jgi:phosphomannomutase
MLAQSSNEYFRFCPGEEHIKISDAICLGRRRSSFPKCSGCQFNDDETIAAEHAESIAAQAAKPTPESMIESVFKAYDVRGVYPEPLNEDIAWRVGHGTATLLRTTLRGYRRSDPRATSLAVGCDMRKSAESLKNALIDGILSTGTSVLDVGMIDTAQLYFAVNHLSSGGGVQVTASHNPAHYNGFKICGMGGAPIGEGSGLEEIKRIARQVTPHEVVLQAQVSSVDLSDDYRQFVRRFLKPVRRLRVVVDASNGMAGKWFPIVFGDINLDVTPLNYTHDGTFVHDPNPLVEANLVQLKDEVRKQNADFGVCFDGDADRLMMVDENADTVTCDFMTGLLAREFLTDFPGSTVLYDLRSSRVVAEEIERAGGTASRERVGHAFMKKAMAESKAIFGGELSGHFYFRDNWFCDSGMLAFVHMVNLLSSADKPFSELVKPLRRYSATGEINFEVQDKDALLDELATKFADADVDRLDGVTAQYSDWWFNARKSNTEPLLRLNVEADTPDLLESKFDVLKSLLGSPVNH